jgi:hypothetical protein
MHIREGRFLHLLFKSEGSYAYKVRVTSLLFSRRDIFTDIRCPPNTLENFSELSTCIDQAHASGILTIS